MSTFLLQSQAVSNVESLHHGEMVILKVEVAKAASLAIGRVPNVQRMSSPPRKNVLNVVSRSQQAPETVAAVEALRLT
jgi:hypothetical protein